MTNPVVVTGGTGYLGRPLIEALLERGRAVYAVVRPESVVKIPPGAVPVIGNALDAASFADALPRNATFVHLVGTPHPNPAKASAFRRVDLESIKAAVAAAGRAGVQHFVYVSVAHPAPVMRAYIAVRQEGEALVRASGMRATILRPWYVIGPGHRWPVLLLPVYALLQRLHSTRSTALRLGLVTRREMIAALVDAIERPAVDTVRTMEVPDIRRCAAL